MMVAKDGNDKGNDGLIRRAYQIVGEPERLVELQAALEIYSRSLDKADTNLDTHFGQANELLQAIPASEEEDFSRFGMDGHLVPSERHAGVLLRLDHNLRIKTVDDPQLRSAGLEAGRDFCDWVVSENDAVIDDLSKLAKGNDTSAAVVVRFYGGLSDARGRLGLAVKARSGDKAAVLIRRMGLQWSERDEEAFVNAFQLTNAETQLVRCLVEAKGVNGFAKIRGSAVSTARNQLKRLQKKLAVSSQGEIISLYAGFVGLLASDSIAARSRAAFPNSGGEMRINGKTIRFERYGRRGGRPVLMLHGALEGPFLPGKVVEEIARYNLDVFVPWMPFYSGAFADLPPMQRIEKFAELIPQILDEVGYACCPIIACSLSTAYAFAAAKGHPERFSGLVLAGMALPLTEVEDKNAMNPAWRTPLELGARFPRFFELFARTIFRLAMRGEVHLYFDRLFKDSPADLATLREPDVAATMRIAAEQRTDRWGAAMAHGFSVMTLDWSEWLKLDDVEVKLIVGAQDVIASPNELMRFSKRHGFDPVGPTETVAGFALFQDPGLILQATADFCR